MNGEYKAESPREGDFEKSIDDKAHLGRAVTNDIDLDQDEVYSHEEQRAIIHRVDRRLVLICGFMYCVSLMDRTNLSAAAIAGMLTDLILIDNRYNIIVLVFFATYVILQPPATVACREIGPKIFLSTITLLWGATMIGMGFTTKWTQMVALRLVLGVFEAGFFPGCVYLLSTWYSRYDVQKRFSVFYLIGCVASAFAGILAYGFMQMAGLDGKNGWQWIFIMEGIITCVIAVVGFLLLTDFPDRAHKSWNFLSKEECDFVIRRVNKDRADAVPERFTFARFLKPALDFKIWCFALIFFCLTTNSYAIAYFLPIILSEGMGFSVGASQCLVAPPYAFAAIVMLTTAWLGDKYHIRGPLLIANALLAIIGLPLLGFVETPAVRYFGVFLVVAGANSGIPTCLAYQANNIRGHWKRAFSSATLVGFGGIGGIAGGTVFRTEDKPLYRPGIWATLACNLLILIIVSCLTIYFRIRNKQVMQGKRILEGLPDFKYTI